MWTYLCALCGCMQLYLYIYIYIYMQLSLCGGDGHALANLIARGGVNQTPAQIMQI